MTVDSVGSFDFEKAFFELKANIKCSPIKKAYLYTGTPEKKGVFLGDVKLSKTALKGLGLTVIKVDSVSFCPSKWDPKASMIFIPGATGEDLDRDLGNQKESIFNYVKKGGGIYTLCGATYWVSQNTFFLRSNGTVIEAKNEFPLCPALAKGPLVPNPHKDKEDYFPTAVELEVPYHHQSLSIKVGVNGGGSFVMNTQSENYKPFGRYVKVLHSDQSVPKELEVAGMRCKIGKGIAMLSMTYANIDDSEYNYPYLEEKYPGNWTSVKEALSNAWPRKFYFALQILQLINR